MDIMHIVQLAEAVAIHRSLKLSTISTYSAGDGKWLGRLKNGDAGCTIRRAVSVISWFNENWPVDLEWPRHIPRPAKSKREAA